MGRKGAHLGSMSTRSARKGAWAAMIQDRRKERASEITRPVLKAALPLWGWEAMYWDRAVWMDPAQRAKQMENRGWTML